VRFKVDENPPIEVAQILEAAGHDAATVNDEGLSGVPDPDLAALLKREGRALVTLDLGFADIRSYPPEEYQGLVVLRLARQDKALVLQTCSRLLAALSTKAIAGQLWIVEAHRLRIWRGEE
jgi:predicted nuclease of predicted toxin-antitoxin system